MKQKTPRNSFQIVDEFNGWRFGFYRTPEAAFRALAKHQQHAREHAHLCPKVVVGPEGKWTIWNGKMMPLQEFYDRFG